VNVNFIKQWYKHKQIYFTLKKIEVSVNAGGKKGQSIAMDSMKVFLTSFLNISG
jgi:hypothetical protein